jgi:HlyD family secretion protein
MNKSIKIILIVAGVAIIAGGYYLYSSYTDAQAARDSISNLETDIIEQGTLVSTISATGKVHSGQSATLNWETSGTVEAVNVEIGQNVKDGDILATLEQLSLPQNIILAQAELTDAQKALDDMYTDAEKAKNEAMKSISTFANEVRDAQYQLDNYTVPSNQVDLETMEALDLMEEKLNQAREAFEPYKHLSSGNNTRKNLLDDLNDAQSEYDSAVKRLDYEYELAVAGANLNEAREDYETWKDGPDSDDIAASQARIAAVEANLSQAWIGTPLGGTVTEAYPQPGDQVSANTKAFRVDDLSKLYVDLEVSEVDINQIEVGQPVTITFDAISNKSYHGSVAEVALIGSDVQGVVEYTVTVELEDVDEDVRPGMTSEVEIVVAQQDRALLIPNQAIRFVDGEQVVFIMKPGGEMVPVEVTLGLSSETHSEVLSGDLKAGDTVVLNPTSMEEAPEIRLPFGRGLQEGGTPPGVGGER